MIEDKAFIKYDTLAPYLRDCVLQKEILVIPGLSEMRKEVASVWQLLNSALQKYLLV